MWDILKTFAPRAVQDLITAAAGIMVAHGYISASQEEGFIGSAFFLAMLVVNYFIAQNRRANAAIAGANAAGATITPATATAIAKGKTP